MCDDRSCAHWAFSRNIPGSLVLDLYHYSLSASIGGQTKKSIYCLCTPSTKDLLYPGLLSKCCARFLGVWKWCSLIMLNVHSVSFCSNLCFLAMTEYTQALCRLANRSHATKNVIKMRIVGLMSDISFQLFPLNSFLILIQSYSDFQCIDDDLA